MISRGIKLGEISGETVQKYLQYHKGEVDIQTLEESLAKQFRCMKKLLRELNISIDDVIQNNLQKIRERYEPDREERI